MVMSVNYDYLRWLYSKVQYAGIAGYSKLLLKLYSTEFYPIISMDENRADDGIELRYRYGREEGVPDYEIAAVLDAVPCSVLEMMIALALKMEEQIMSDPEKGNRTSRWFTSMLYSLGLMTMGDIYFDENYVDFVLNRFLEREYEPYGQGGLFTLVNPPGDLRNTEIWYQMCWYLDEIANTYGKESYE